MGIEKTTIDVLKKIAEERDKRGWTEYTLSKNSGITQSTISTWYRKNSIPTIPNLEKICDGFGMTLSEFFHDDSQDNNMTSEKRELIAVWEKMSPAQREALLIFIHAFQ